ncbi:phosphatidate cytidylyltransferase [Massilioclostridium coli]|uniref:phosphatidate cytidylyltransferase n=1 Tax=Massilioclostridium coli TaxID=1870991 RepID=UPI000D7AB884|nr:CDP-archaeol synthase [Massilioclostridium coli]PWN00114.1 MAG: hypothetical protein DBX37_02810 [Massilioclostridium sp.]
MKQRILSAVVGLSVLVVILCFYQTVVLNIGIALIAVIGTYEILKTTGNLSQKLFSAVCMVFAAAAPFMKMDGFPDVRTIAILIFLLIIFTILLKTHNQLHVSGLAICVLGTFGISFTLSNLVYIRDDFSPNSLYYIMLIFVLAWICDGGAYFVGRAFGKHKMAPQISPNKTVEGAIGGIVTNLVLAVVFTFIYTAVCHLEFPAKNYIPLLILAFICSFVGILGDLTASIVKRQYKIKDFGNLIPGHGGVVDRFDSIFFVAPVIYVFAGFFPIL